MMRPPEKDDPNKRGGGVEHLETRTIFEYKLKIPFPPTSERPASVHQLLVTVQLTADAVGPSDDVTYRNISFTLKGGYIHRTFEQGRLGEVRTPAAVSASQEDLDRETTLLNLVHQVVSDQMDALAGDNAWKEVHISKPVLDQLLDGVSRRTGTLLASMKRRE